MPYSDAQIVRRIKNCPTLGSLRRINEAFSELARADQFFSSEISEIVSRDQILTARILKTVNSVFFSLSRQITDIEEAIFYLGPRQIRQMAIGTPILDDILKVSPSGTRLNLQALWQRSLGCALLTRELLSLSGSKYHDDTDYIVGLVHDIGEVVLAAVFREEFDAILERCPKSERELHSLQTELIGWNSGRIGANFLERHLLPEEITEAILCWRNPTDAKTYPRTAAALALAKEMVSSLKELPQIYEFIEVPLLEISRPLEEFDWSQRPSWRILFPPEERLPTEPLFSIRFTLKRLPRLLRELI